MEGEASPSSLLPAREEGKTGARSNALSPCGRGHHWRQQKTQFGEGLPQQADYRRIEPLIRQPSAATFSHKGRREEGSFSLARFDAYSSCCPIFLRESP